MSKDKHYAYPVTQAAKTLSVSTATVRNWLKTGVIAGDLSPENVASLQAQLADGTLNRLTTRANKSNSAKRFVPAEYANNTAVFQGIQSLVAMLQAAFPNDIRQQLAYSAAGYCKAFFAQEKTSEKDTFRLNEELIHAFIAKYRPPIEAHLPAIDEVSCQQVFADIIASSVFDPLGLLYQSLRSEGSKSAGGSYYTPPATIDALLSQLCLSPKKTMIAPCCGTGSFLLRALQAKQATASTLFGVDIDENATFLATINVLLHSPQFNQSPNIFTADALSAFATGDECCDTNQYLGYFDTLATNPPWGSRKNTAR